MTQFRKSTAAAAAGLAALTFLAAPGFANSEHHGVQDAALQSPPARVQLAHMGQGPTGGPGMMGQGPGGAPGMMDPGPGYGPGYGMGPCQGYGPGYGTGSGMMGPGMMGPSYGYGHGYGMGPGMMSPGQGYGPGYGMGPGMMGPGMMGPGQGNGPGPGYGRGPGMMGPGMGGQGMMGPDFGQVVTPNKDLSADDVRHFFEHRLEMHGNKHLKVGEVKETDQDTIVADIVTQDGSLVQRLKVDRHSGQMQQSE